MTDYTGQFERYIRRIQNLIQDDRNLDIKRDFEIQIEWQVYALNVWMYVLELTSVSLFKMVHGLWKFEKYSTNKRIEIETLKLHQFKWDIFLMIFQHCDKNPIN